MDRLGHFSALQAPFNKIKIPNFLLLLGVSFWQRGRPQDFVKLFRKLGEVSMLTIRDRGCAVGG
jgi:hypothetical protein